MHVLVVALAGVVGLVAGSFLTVVVHRVPERRSIVAPGSSCPACGAAIRPVDNVPVLSYLLRRGRCRACGAAISLRYPALELGTALLFLAVAVPVGTGWAVPAYCVLAAALVALSAIDLERMRLPTPIIWVTAALGAPLLVLASAGTGDWAALVRAAIAGAVALAAFGAMYLLVPKGIGFGDVRLAALCGMFLGWLGYRVALVGFLAGFLAGGVVGAALVLAGRAGRRTRVPFGPFLALGTLVAVCYGAPIARAWLG